MADIAAPATKRGLFDDFGYYIRWWLLLGAVGGFLTLVEQPDENFWKVKLIQVIWGLGSGVLFAVVFTPIQNLANAGRKRWLTWVIAVAVWLGVKFAVAFATLGLQ